MSEPRRSTRARAREEAAPVPETPSKDKAVKGGKPTLKRKRPSAVATPTTPATPTTDEATPAAPKHTLPLRITEGQPLPTLPEPQPLELAAGEWQDIQQSGVLSASLQQSRAVWVSGVNFRTFHEFFTQPKKVGERTDEDKARQQRQKELHKNFPPVGAEAQLVIEPHTFNIKLYGPREVPRTLPRKPPPTYGAWPNHSQPTPYPHPHPHSHPHPHPHPHQFAHQPYPKAPVAVAAHAHAPVHAHQPQSRPPPPPPPKPTPPASATPAPDPVIHMLAARAGTDPELKAVMKIVAAGQATKEQLEFFQIHIQELTDIVAAQKEAAAKPPTQPPAPPQPHASTAPPPPAKAAAPPVQTKPNTAPAQPLPYQTPVAPPRPVQPAPHHQLQPPLLPPSPLPPSSLPPPSLPQQQLQQHQQPQQHMPKPHNPVPPPTHQQHPPLHTNTYSNNSTPFNQPQQYRPPQHAPSFNAAPPPRTTYRPLVFSFVEGNQDMFYFPSYSFMEWLPNGSGAKLSFLITKPKPTPKPNIIKAPPSTPAPNTPTPAATQTQIQTQTQTQTQTPSSASSSTPLPPTTNAASTPFTPTPTPTLTPAPLPVPFIPPPRIEDFDEKHQIDTIDMYQPVTVLLLTDNYDIKNALARAIRPPDVVERYMEEVFDRCKRAGETYLAFRLPKEGGGEVIGKEKEREREREKEKDGGGTPLGVGIGIADGGGWGGYNGGMTAEKKKAGRPRKSFV